MRVRLVGHSGEPCMKVGKNGAWYSFVKVLESNGFEVVTKPYGAPVDALIANTHSQRAIKESKSNNVDRKMRVLILWEPKTTNHKLHKSSVLDQYSNIYSPTKEWGHDYKVRLFKWPVLKLKKRTFAINHWSQRQNKAVMILANKSSPIKGQLYSVRRKLAVLTSRSQTMDLYGLSWNEKSLSNYFKYLGRLIRTPLSLIDIKSWKNLNSKLDNFYGVCENKRNISENYRIIVVIENSKTYISEKFFDAHDSGAIVIYSGAQLSKFGIPNTAAVQVEPNALKISEAIEHIQSLPIKEQYDLMKSQQKAILSVAKDWFGNQTMTQLAQDISKQLKKGIK